MEEKIHIRVETTNKELQELVGKFNDANITIGEMARLKKLLTAEAKNVINAFDAESKEAKKFKDALENVNNVQQKAKLTTGGLHQKYFELGKKLRETFLQMQNFAVVGATLFGLKELGEGAARVEMLRNQLAELTKKEGVNVTSFLIELRKATGNSVSDLELLQKATEFKLAGTGVAQIPQLLAFADDRAKLLGKTFDEVADMLLKMELGSGEKVAQTLRLNIDVKKANEEFAKSIGTTASELSKAGQQQAFFNEALRVAEQQQNSLAGANTKVIDSYEKTDAAIKNLSDSLGNVVNSLSPILHLAAKTINSMAQGVSSVLRIIEYAMKGLEFGYSIVQALLEKDFNKVNSILSQADKEKKTFLADMTSIGKQIEQIWESQEEGAKKANDEQKKYNKEQLQSFIDKSEKTKKLNEQEKSRKKELEDEVKIIRDKFDVGELTKQKAIEELNILKSKATTERERLNILKEIIAVTEAKNAHEQAAERRRKSSKNETLTPFIDYEGQEKSKKFFQDLSEKKISMMEKEVNLGLKSKTNLLTLLRNELKIEQSYERQLELKQKISDVENEIVESDMAAQAGLSAINSMVSALNSEFKKAWENVFGEANSLLEKFSEAFFEFLAEAMVKLAIFKILDFATGGAPIASMVGKSFGFLAEGGIVNEPIIGKGRNSGRGYVIGEAGAEAIIPLNKLNMLMQELRFGFSKQQAVRPVNLTVQLGNKTVENVIVNSLGKTFRTRKI